MNAAPPPPVSRRLSTRLLRSPLVDLLLGPHGVDRYLEVVRPVSTVIDARAEVIAIQRQTAQRHPDAAPQLGLEGL